MSTQPRGVTVLGSGVVEVTVAAGLASLGHRVVLGEVAAGSPWDTEPGLSTLVRRTLLTGRLGFLRRLPAGIDTTTVLVRGDGSVPEIPRLPRDCVLVDISPSEAAERFRWNSREDAAPVSSPLFLHAGSMVEDFLAARHLVVGADDEAAVEHVAALYQRLPAEIVRTDVRGAELVRNAVNGYFALKQSYVNALADVCAAVGADITSVAEALSYDRRFGDRHITPAAVPRQLRHSLESLSRDVEPERELLHDVAAFVSDSAAPGPR
ncbi:UDPglucose 6-dehydrogenase [Saccharopolyspora lacisalsi]|uniref:UDP-glucose 6-dehydrogenase n=1 Tax=Halosaccharopolyspora lacisalsi TaxID=1000566 RepID=A0A839DZL6_9PSEU|nr:hypothetical protein [Halosaccharopolyspora lacisalsi]MBA8824855.1 UDPglucose 6-dehydrogenase [Halosaccharopolyspora lacisalsi]